MRTFWKWVLGIVVAIVIVAALGLAGFWVYTHWGGRWMMDPRAREVLIIPRQGPQDEVPRWQGRMPMRPLGRMPFYGMHGRTLGAGSALGWILGGLFRLGLLALLILGIVALARLVWPARMATVSVTAVPAATQPAAVQPAVACPNCSYTVQAGWKHCPNCGSALST
jgi:hypothetical protein